MITPFSKTSGVGLNKILYKYLNPKKTKLKNNKKCLVYGGIPKLHKMKPQSLFHFTDGLKGPQEYNISFTEHFGPLSHNTIREVLPNLDFKSYGLFLFFLVIYHGRVVPSVGWVYGVSLRSTTTIFDKKKSPN